MSAPNDVGEQHLCRTAPPREPIAGWRGIGCRATLVGWPTDDTETRHAAEIDALAEAGATGSISDLPVGAHCCDNCLNRCTKVQCRTMVCPMAVDKLARRWGERNGWKRQRPSFRSTAPLGDQLELSELLNDLAAGPEQLTKRKEMREAS